MNQNAKGTRKDTPAHVQMPSPLRRQIRDMTQTKLEEEKESQNEVVNNENNGPQSTPNINQEAVKKNRIRKPTPAYVQRQASKKGKQKSVSFEENLLEEDEDEEKVKITGDLIDISKHQIHRKDTPAVLANPRPSSRARTLNDQDSITEEDENEDDFDESLMSYRLRKQSILQCSHPSVEEINLKVDKH